MGQAPILPLQQQIADETGEENPDVLNLLVRLVLGARAIPDQLARQKMEAADNIEPILARGMITMPGHGTAREEAERLVEIAIRFI